jgi:GAF domain-containing protein
MSDKDRLLNALRSFAIAMGKNYDIQEVSQQLSEHVAAALDARGAGVSVADKSEELRFLTATSQTIVAIEEVQEKYQEGPCVEAFSSQEPKAISDLEDETEWEPYRARAKEIGLRSVVGYPLSYDGRRLGALNLYDDKPREWTEEELEDIGVFSDMATAYLIRESQLAETTRIAEQLQNALSSRVVIEQAKGVLSVKHQITVDEAFDRLRKHARSKNLSLRNLAQEAVDGEFTLPAE